MKNKDFPRNTSRKCRRCRSRKAGENQDWVNQETMPILLDNLSSQGGTIVYWVPREAMILLLSRQETQVVKFVEEEDGFQYLEVAFRGIRVVTIARELAHLLPKNPDIN